MLFACFELKRSVSCLLERREHRLPLFTSLESKQGVSSLLDESVSRLLEGSEHRHVLPACFELNLGVCGSLDTSEHRQPLFTSLVSKQGVSSLLDESVSSLLEGSEHRHVLPACFDMN
jgi:hypothetical protein